MDAFPKFVGAGGALAGFGKSLVMGYYDGDTSPHYGTTPSILH
jgi:hypothetical protein